MNKVLKYLKVFSSILLLDIAFDESKFKKPHGNRKEALVYAQESICNVSRSGQTRSGQTRSELSQILPN